MREVRVEIRPAVRRLRFAANYLPVLLGALFAPVFCLIALGSTNLWIGLVGLVASGVGVAAVISGRPYLVIRDGRVQGRNLLWSCSVEVRDITDVRLHSLRLGKGDHCPSIKVVGRSRRVPLLALFLWDSAELERVLQEAR